MNRYEIDGKLVWGTQCFRVVDKHNARRVVARCERDDDALLICAALNAYGAQVEATLQELRK